MNKWILRIAIAILILEAATFIVVMRIASQRDFSHDEQAQQ